MKKLMKMLTVCALTLALTLAATFAYAEETLVIYGNRSTCSYCKKLDTLKATPEFKEFVESSDIAVVDCDKTAEPANYAKYKSKVGYVGGDWPQIFILGDNGERLGSFKARGYTATTLIEKIKSMCPSCADGNGTPPVTPPPAAATSTFACPKCKAKLEVK